MTSDEGASWLAFLRGLVSRGPAGVQLVVSDAHQGLQAASASTLPGACWQRCRTHFMRNLLTRVAKSAQDFVASLVGSIFAQPDPASLHVQHLRVVGQLERGFPEAAELLADAGPEILAFAAFPKEHWKRIRWNNPQVRLNREVGVMLPTKFRDGSVPASYENLRVLEEAPRILPPGVETVPGRADSASAPMPWTGRADARRLGNGPRSRRPQ